MSSRSKLYKSYAAVALSMAELATRFETERYTQPRTQHLPRSILKPWQFVTRRDRGKDSSQEKISRLGIGKRKQESMDISHAKRMQYLEDIIYEISGNPVNMRSKPGTTEYENEERFKIEGRTKLAQPWQEFQAALPNQVKALGPQLLDYLRPDKHWIAPALHVLQPDRVIIEKYEGDHFVNERLLASVKHKFQLIADAEQNNITWSSKNLAQLRKYNSLDNRFTLGVAEILVDPFELIKRKIRKVLNIPVDKTRYRQTMDHIDEFGLVRYSFVEEPETIPILLHMAQALDKYEPGTKRKVEEGMRYILHKLGQDPSVMENRDIDEILSRHMDFAKDNIDPLTIWKREKIEPETQRLFDLANTLDDLAQINSAIWDGPLGGINIKDTTIDDNITETATKISGKKYAWFVRDEHGFPFLQTKLAMESGRWTFGLSDHAHHLFNEARKDFGFLEKFKKYVPINEEHAKMIGKYYHKIAAYVGNVPESEQELHELSLHKENSVMPPDKLGGMLYNHRWGLGFVIGARILKGAADHRHGNKFGIFFGKAGYVLTHPTPENAIAFVADILQYTPGDHKKTYGPIETDKLPEADAVIDLVAQSRINGTYDMKAIRDMHYALGQEMQLNPDNIRSRFAAGVLTLATGQYKDAQEHFKEVQGWLHTNKAKYVTADDSERFFLMHQLLGATEFYLSQLARRDSDKHAHLALLHDAYKSATTALVLKTQKAARGDLQVKSIAELTLEYPSSSDENLVDVMRNIIYSPLDFNYRNKAVGMLLHEDVDRAQLVATQSFSFANELGKLLTHSDLEAIIHLKNVKSIQVPPYVASLINDHPAKYAAWSHLGSKIA